MENKGVRVNNALHVCHLFNEIIVRQCKLLSFRRFMCKRFRDSRLVIGVDRIICKDGEATVRLGSGSGQ